ncbi:MAG: peptidylprolyl isomerase [Crocinitomicaceae bacterium]
MKKTPWILFLALLVNLNLAAQKVDKKSLKDGIYANFITDKGNILVKLESEKAPMTVANFVGLSEGNYQPFDSIEIKKPIYVNIKFHRVIANFMIQGGDPLGTGEGSAGYSFFDEFNDSLKHDRAGVLSMANSGPNTNGSQFFITHKDTPWLDGKHSIFGKVVAGQDVVDSIKQNDMLQRVDIFRIGKAAKKFNATEVFRKNYEKRKAEMKAEEDRIANAKKMSIDEYKVYFKNEIEKEYPGAIQTESGLMILISKPGEDPKPNVGQEVTVHYTGMFTNGKKFDSSRDRNSPFTFPLGQGRVIKGWDEGIGMIGKGGKATLIIPYYLGYGARGQSIIPPYATLVFDVEMLSY